MRMNWSAFLSVIVSNSSTWSTGFSAALASEQALVAATPACAASYTYIILLKYLWKVLKIAVCLNHFVSNGELRLKVPSLFERGLNMHLPPKIWQFLSLCDNCDIKNRRKQVKKFGQPWLILTVQYLVCILTVAIFTCVSGHAKNFVSVSLLSFFIVPRRSLGQERLRKMKKRVHFIG